MTPLTELERAVLGFLAAAEHGQGRFTVTDGAAYLVGSGLEFPVTHLDNWVARRFIRLLSARFIRDAGPGRPSQVLAMAITEQGKAALLREPGGS
jgi:hypothetical protein